MKTKDAWNKLKMTFARVSAKLPSSKQIALQFKKIKLPPMPDGVKKLRGVFNAKVVFITVASSVFVGGTAYFMGEALQDPQCRVTPPKGDGHPVIVIPGFMGGDGYMHPVINRVQAQGYKAYGWEQGVNKGADVAKAEGLAKHLKKVFEENGKTKVTLVGYSFGGVYARELARAHPDMVLNVITMGTPFGLKDDKGASDKRVSALYEAYQGKPATDIAQMIQPPPVPTTSIYSNGDWIVDAASSQNAPSALAENIRVAGGHLMMPLRPEPLNVLLERLSSTSGGTWKPVSCEAPKR